MNTTNKRNYEYVNHPDHYNNYSKEVIDMMIDIFGLQNTIKWCEMTAFKYRMRMGTKPDNSIEQDLKKEQWYLNKAHDLQFIGHPELTDTDELNNNLHKLNHQDSSQSNPNLIATYNDDDNTSFTFKKYPKEYYGN